MTGAREVGAASGSERIRLRNRRVPGLPAEEGLPYPVPLVVLFWGHCTIWYTFGFVSV